MSGAVRIRQATVEDLAAIGDLATHWQHEETNWGQQIGDFERYLGGNGYLFIAEDRDSVLAFLAARVRREELAVFDTDEPYVDIEELYVTPHHRGKGIGSLLLNELKDAAHADGIIRFHVFSASKNLDWVISFYRRHGFEMWGMQAYAISANKGSDG